MPFSISEASLHSPTISHKETNSPRHSHRNKVSPPAFPSSTILFQYKFLYSYFAVSPYYLFSLLKAIGRVG